MASILLFRSVGPPRGIQKSSSSIARLPATSATSGSLWKGEIARRSSEREAVFLRQYLSLSLSLSLLLPYYYRTLSQSQYIYLKKMEESEEIPVPQQSGEVRPVPRLLCFLSETAPANAKKAKLTKMNYRP